MKQLELQQEQEERDLVARGTETDSTGAAGSTNDSVTFTAATSDEGQARERRRDYANAKSMPGSRRHSGELRGEDALIAAGGPEARRALIKGGEGAMLNSFQFDDELDADLQSESLQVDCVSASLLIVGSY